MAMVALETATAAAAAAAKGITISLNVAPLLLASEHRFVKRRRDRNSSAAVAV